MNALVGLGAGAGARGFGGMPNAEGFACLSGSGTGSFSSTAAFVG